MARIEEKSKQKLSSVIWTWVVVGVLGAVVITGLVLGIIYLVNLNKDDDGEKTFEEQYPNAELWTWEELEDLLDPHVQNEMDGTLYVLVYSPDYENYPNGEKIKDKVNAAVNAGVDNFFVVNVTSEDNKDYSLTNTDLSSLSYPTLLVIDIDTESGHIVIDETINNWRDINNKLNDITPQE